MDAVRHTGSLGMDSSQEINFSLTGIHVVVRKDRVSMYYYSMGLTSPPSTEL